MSSAPAISIAVETPLSDEMRVMVGELNDLLLSLTSEDACHHLTVEQMADARTTVFVARVDGKLAACGSLYRHKGRHCAKSSACTPVRLTGAWALDANCWTGFWRSPSRKASPRLVLETGVNYDAAKRLYETSGFKVCGPVLDYPEHPESLFYSRRLTAA
jgi:putative acetyltransferase